MSRAHSDIIGLDPNSYTLDQQGLKHHFWRYNFWFISIITCCIIGASAWFIDRNNFESYLQKSRSDVQDQLSILRARLEGQLNSNIQAVNGLVSAIGVEPSMDQERFAMFAKPLLERDNQLRNIAGAPDMVIRYMYPLEGNQAAIGLNFLKNEQQRQAAVTARDSGKLVLAGPVDLLQGGQGFIGRIPVFSEYIVEGERRFWGLVSAVIDINELYRASGLLDTDLSIDVAIFGHDKRFSNGSVFYGDEHIFTQHPVVSFIELPFGNWQMAALPKGGWPTQADNAWHLRWIMLFVSLSILAPIISFAWLNNKHRDQQIRLNALFQLSPIGIALNDFETGQYLYVNQSLANDTGYTLEELRELSYWDLTPKLYAEEEAKHIEDLKTRGRYGPFEKEYINSNGERYPIILQGVLITDSNGKQFIWSYIQNITQEKLAQEQLADKNRQLELIINATEVGIWDWQVQTGALSLNNRWAEIIGYTLEELGDISIETWLSHAHPDDLEESGNLLEDHWQGKTESYIFEGRMRHKNGHDVWILDTGKVIEWLDDGQPKRMVGTHLDITEKKQAEQKIAKANESLANQVKLIQVIAKTQSDFIQQTNLSTGFSNLLTDLMSLTDSQLAFIGRVNYKNGSAIVQLQEFTYHKNNQIHIDFFQGKNPKDAIFKNHDNLFVQSANSQTPLFLNHTDATNIHTPKGHPKIERFLAIPIIKQNKVTAMIGLANSGNRYDQNLINWLKPLINTVGQIIEQIDYLAEKEKTEIELINARNEAEAAGNAKTEFLATMSHEIRTPMNGVLGMLNLLNKSDLTQEQSRKVDIARMSANSLLSIINDILDITKIDSGKLALEKFEFNLRKEVDDICQSMALRAQEKNIDLVIDLSGLKHDVIISDPVRIRQILTNLIGNANKFTAGGEIIIRLSSEIRNDKSKLHCDIIDTGIGIEQSKIDSLFHSFTQADTSTTREFGGTGLGLSICKKICEMMGGNIWATSELGRGSCFSFEILVDIPKKQTTISLPDKFSDLEILIVDSNKKNAQAVTSQIRAWGNQATMLFTIEDAKNALRKGIEYDLIIIDSKFSNSSSIDFAKFVRNDFQDMKVRLVLMTNVNQELSDQEIHNAGFNTYFLKPVTTIDLLTCFESLEHHNTDTLEGSEKNSQQALLPSNCKILLVEDIAFNQEVALMLLADMGVIADVANNGQEAVNKVKVNLKNHSPYDVILMDCQMPVMDGYEATKEIRRLESATDHKSHIIAMTANAMSGDKQKCLAAGMDDYLSKPIEEERLYNTVLKWMTGNS